VSPRNDKRVALGEGNPSRTATACSEPSIHVPEQRCKRGKSSINEDNGVAFTVQLTVVGNWSICLASSPPGGSRATSMRRPPRVKPLCFLVVSAPCLIADQREAQVPLFFLSRFLAARIIPSANLREA
jgi:hypothetical protein